MPHVYVSEDGQVSFTDGRHRFAWFRDRGVKAMPVTVATAKEAFVAKRFFGSRRRTIQVHEAAFREALIVVANEKERQRKDAMFLELCSTEPENSVDASDNSIRR